MALAAGGVVGEESSGTVTLVKNQSLMTGLLLVEVSEENYAARASQMNATAVPLGDRTEPSTLKFNQEVGDSMAKALEEVRKFLTVRHKGWPEGHSIELAFQDKYSPKDGPSAAVACALMIEGLVAGCGLDPKTAVTGDMNADGSIQPVGGVADKVRGAIKGGFGSVIVPKKCENQVWDAALIDGLPALYSIQIFSAEKFDDAVAIATSERGPKLVQAMATFETIQTALRRQGLNAPAALAHPKMIERLQSVVTEAPTHLSARLLLLKAQGRAEPKLSLSGSWSQLAKSGDMLIRAVKDRSTDALAPDALGVAGSRISKLRSMLDPRLKRYADTLIDLAQEIRQAKLQPKRTATEQAKALDRIIQKAEAVDSEYERLRTDKELMEEMMD
jgi:hypothetical protein